MKKWAFDPKNGLKRVKQLTMSHPTILNGRKQPRLVSDMLWNDSRPCQEISQISINGNHYPFTPFI